MQVGWDFAVMRREVEVLEKTVEREGGAFWRRRSGAGKPSGVDPASSIHRVGTAGRRGYARRSAVRQKRQREPTLTAKVDLQT